MVPLLFAIPLHQRTLCLGQLGHTVYKEIGGYSLKFGMQVLGYSVRCLVATHFCCILELLLSSLLVILFFPTLFLVQLVIVLGPPNPPFVLLRLKISKLYHIPHGQFQATIINGLRYFYISNRQPKLIARFFVLLILIYESSLLECSRHKKSKTMTRDGIY